MIHIYSIHSTFLGRMETTRLGRKSLEPLSSSELRRIWEDAKQTRLSRSPHMAHGHPLNLVSCVISDLIAEKGFERIDEVELFEHCNDAGYTLLSPGNPR